MPLVTYESSSDEEEEAIQAPPAKKRKLPSLSPSLTIATPIDNPALHQGRIRASPHVDGQFAAHVYVSLTIERQSTLYKLLDSAFKDAKSSVPALHALWLTGGIGRTQRAELHISLSRPIYLRAHQRDEFKRAVKGLTTLHSPFTVSFATFAELINDDRTRIFLVMEVGAGHRELRSLVDLLTPSLQSIRQKEYYAQPRFHTSIAWALLDRPPITDTGSLISSEDGQLSEDSPGPTDQIGYPTITHFPEDLVSSLNERYGARLASTNVGAFEVRDITVKIGKDVSCWQLVGSSV